MPTKRSIQMDRPRIVTPAKRQRAKEALARREEIERERKAAAQKREEEERKRALVATDHGRALLAYEAGETFYQVQRVVSTTRGETPWLAGASSLSAEADQSANVRTGTSLASLVSELEAQSTDDLPVTQALGIIEKIGWTLVHVGYTYRETYAKSRDRFFASGQQVAKSGEIVAIYLFRRADSGEG